MEIAPKMNTIKFLKIAFVLTVGLTLGCSTAQKTIPHLSVGGMTMEAHIERDDLVVLDTVEASSSTLSILAGLIQIIDGSNVKILGIPFFKDKYTYFSEGWSLFGIQLIRFTSPEDRAYYKALEAQADADLMFQKSVDREQTGIPFLFEKSTVTFRGKALRFKPDR